MKFLSEFADAVKQDVLDQPVLSMLVFVAAFTFLTIGFASVASVMMAY